MMSLPENLAASALTLHALTALVFLVAGAVKGVVGLGLPTIAMALLALMMTPSEAAALLIVPSLMTNVWQMRPWRSLRSVLGGLGTMQFGIVAGTLAGAWVLGAPAGAWATATMGAALVAYAIWGLTGTRLSLSARTAAAIAGPVGAATGILTAVTGVFALPAVPYLQALDLARDRLVQAMGLSFTVSTLALATGLAINGRYPMTSLSLSFVMLLPALLGMAAGGMLRGMLSPVVFRHFFFGILILLGLHLMTT